MDFLHGSIVRIKLENFLTYDSAEFCPGPKLNVIIGPNGSGKSSIVCAICLGLGGKTNSIGRAGNVNEFIKIGCQKARIEIELHNKFGNNYIVCREIKRDNSSSWMLNREMSSNKMIDQLMAKLNIQIGNLCQIMPQDKVADFVKMTQQELLENTEKTVGTEGMYQSHCELKNFQAKLKTLQISYQNNSTRLDSEIQKNNRLEEDVKNFREREKYIETIETLNKKKPFVEYSEIRNLHGSIKKRADELKKSLLKIYDEAKPQQIKVEKSNENLKNYEDKLNSLSKQIQDANTKRIKVIRNLETLSDKLLDLKEDFNSKKVVEADRKTRFDGLKRQLDALENELNSISDDGDILVQLSNVTSDIQKLLKDENFVQSDLESTQNEIEEIKIHISNIQVELKKVQDVRERRLQMLRQKDRKAYEAVMWLRQNGNKFKKTIHEPIMVTINVHDPSMAVYVESHINYNDLFAFVCEDLNDMNEFLYQVRDQRGLSVSAVLAPDEPPSEYQPEKPIEHFKKYGFRCYLRDLFTAPDAVLSYLCRQYRIHQIPVGNEYTKQVVQRVINEAKFSNFYTERHHYTSKKSKYSQNISTVNRELRQPSLLIVTMNMELLASLQNKLKQYQEALPALESKCSDFCGQIKELRDEIAKLQEEKKILSKKRDKRKNCTMQIAQKKESIRRCEAEAINLDHEMELSENKLSSVLVSKMKAIKLLVESAKECKILMFKKMKLNTSVAFAMKEKFNAENEYRKLTSSAEEKERDFSSLKEQLRETKTNATRLLEIAKKGVNLKSNEDLPEHLIDLFAQCPDTVQEINAMIYENQARADVLLQTDKNVVEEYETRKREITTLTNKSAKQKEDVDVTTQKMNELKAKWLPEVEGIIKKINENFSAFFQSLGCCGEVCLKKGETSEEEFDKYAINIRVKYRDSEQLRDLSFEQSGGERSVATILYMMALQELTHVPFRCVDEINQGMDSTNERRVFELMVETSSREDTAQYFLLTPKLLPDLNYNENMTLLCVYNSCYNPDHSEWNMKKFLSRRAKLTC